MKQFSIAIIRNWRTSDWHILNYRLGLSTNRVVFEVHYQRGVIQRGYLGRLVVKTARNKKEIKGLRPTYNQFPEGGTRRPRFA